MPLRLKIFGELQPTIDGLWALNSSYSPPSNEEYDKAYKALEAHLKQRFYSDTAYYEKCYVRGDNYGDYTQCLEILDPSVLSVELILCAQAWLKHNPYWRIMSPCHIEPSRCFAVYAQSIRYVNEIKIPLHDAIFDTRCALESYEKYRK